LARRALIEFFDNSTQNYSFFLPSLPRYTGSHRENNQEQIMLEVRKSEERGQAHHGWLQSQHSFSFADYYDPRHVGFGPLRVINEDRVAPGAGFGTHAHRDMEIISYVLDGALEHKDSMGTGSVLHYGDVQRMSAGSGVRHSEFNGSKTEPVHFLQIWIQPNQQGIAPSYEEKRFPLEDKQGKLRLIASGDGREGSVLIHQDASLYVAILDGDDQLEHPLGAKRLGYVHVIRGQVEVNGVALKGGDALKIAGEERVGISRAEAAELLLFDLPE
jgi:redox-sensitive bicupin YhaK (pirin superfamily)